MFCAGGGNASAGVSHKVRFQQKEVEQGSWVMWDIKDAKIS